MAAMINKKCACCGKAITVRLADHRRGWGKYCSKSCKAIKQEQRTGQYAHYRATSELRVPMDAGDRLHDAAMYGLEMGWDGHKDIF